MLELERLKSMRNLGTIYIDERDSVKELRCVLREMLSKGVEKVIKICRESAQKATVTATAAAESAATGAPGKRVISLYVIVVVVVVCRE